MRTQDSTLQPSACDKHAHIARTTDTSVGLNRVERESIRDDPSVSNCGSDIQVGVESDLSVTREPILTRLFRDTENSTATDSVSARVLCTTVAHSCPDSAALIQPLASASSFVNTSSGPRNSRLASFPSPLRSILVNHPPRLLD